MPVTLNELLEQAVKEGLALADEKEIEAAREALKKHLNPLYVSINNLGFGAAQAKATKELTDAGNALKVAEDKVKELEASLRAAVDKNPDVATVNKQWETQVQAQTEAHRKEVERLTGRIRNSLLARDQAQLAQEMHEKYRVPLSLAKTLVKDPDLLSRCDYDDNGVLSVRQAGQAIPIMPGSGQTYLSALAEEVASTVEKDLLLSDGDAGSGVNGGSHPGGGDTAFFKRIAENAKKEQASGQPRVSLQERIASR